MLLGYARVSTADQNPDHQTDALHRAGVTPTDVYLDHASGAKASRPQLDQALRNLREGDTLIITRLDRLGRSVLHLVTLGASLRERGIGLKVLEQGIDTSTAEGRAMFGMLSVLAELQRELIVANTRDGLATARSVAEPAGAARNSPPRKHFTPKSSTTPAITPSNRSPTYSAYPALPSTDTSTRHQSANAPPPATARRPPLNAGSCTAAPRTPILPIRCLRRRGGRPVHRRPHPADGVRIQAVAGVARRCYNRLGIDAAVGQAFLAALAGDAPAACLAAAQQLSDGHDSALEQYRRQVQQARYDATKAERRYLAVDAENRLVARGLETAWEKALTSLAATEAELGRRERQAPKPLTAEQQSQILKLSENLDVVFSAPSTTDRDRKELLGTLLTDVTISIDRAAGHADLVLRWKGGAITELTVPLIARNQDRLRTDEDTVDLVRRLALHYTDAQIAGILGRQKRLTATDYRSRPAECRAFAITGTSTATNLNPSPRAATGS